MSERGRELPWGADPATPDVAVEEETTEETRIETPWRVILFDDNIHTFDEVIFQLVKATGCTEARAEEHAWTVHTRGKDCVYEGEFFDCLRVQGVLREIELVTEIEG
ncbi:MAG TPA: ATP-dependent Clp protease adaptor ClpS [Rubricoccaceae bacterium]|nr:ATP-dependent Clp protease adaptor ClpS [Rubricoccaceae bacterium]